MEQGGAEQMEDLVTAEQGKQREAKTLATD
jgi:hypothetical protein